MSEVVDMTGKRVSAWIVLRYADGKWLCRCKCGYEAWVAGSKLRRGKSKCCVKCRRATHKRSGNDPTYQSWKHMRRRCLSKLDDDYAHYGGRGITICKRWDRFENFLADMGEKPAGLTLDRRDNNGNYTPQNCRWVTQKEQTRNQRRNRIIEFKGRRQSLANWCDELGVNYHLVHRRLRAKWPLEACFNTQKFNSKQARIDTYGPTWGEQPNVL